MKKVTILGVTGSIGTQTLDVIRNDIKNFDIVGISANTNYQKIIPIIEEFKPKYVAMMDEEASLKLKKYCRGEKIFNGNIAGTGRVKLYKYIS